MFEFLEQCASGPREFLKRPLVERYQQLGDGAVKVIEVEEGLMSKAGENPAFDDLHGDLHFGFVNYLQMQAVPPDGMTFGAPA